MHSSAVHFVIFSLLLPQMVLLCFSVLRGGSLTNNDVLDEKVVVGIFFITFYTLLFITFSVWVKLNGDSLLQVNKTRE